jgi:hypothetical protein
LRWLATLVILSFVILPIGVSADVPDANVNVIAVPYTGWAITGFTAVYVTDTQVDVSWIPDFGVLNTMIRAKYGSAPTSVTDGYLVYYGNAHNTSDTSMNFDESLGQIYYRAFAETAPGVYDDSTLPASVEGVVMTLIALILLSLGLTIGGEVKKNVMLVVAGALFWAILGAYAYYLSTTLTTGMSAIYYALFWGGMAMSIVCVLSGAWLARGKGDLALDEMVSQPAADEDNFSQEMYEQRKKLSMMKDMRDGTYIPPQKQIGKGE